MRMSLRDKVGARNRPGVFGGINASLMACALKPIEAGKYGDSTA
jgi:hypothetical protein